MKYIWPSLLIVCCSLSSCIVDKTTRYVATIHNESGVPIQILPFKSGSVLPNDSIELHPGDQIEIANGSTLGEVKTPFFQSEIFAIGENDSIVVIFNSNYRVTHYVKAPENRPEKYHLYDSDRNLILRENYTFKIVERKKSRINHHDYYFIPKDYEYAGK